MKLTTSIPRTKTSRFKSGLRFLVGAVFLCLFFADQAVACPTCKDTLGLHAIRVQMGYALSIGFMMAVPFGIIAAWTIAIYRMIKQQKDSDRQLSSDKSISDAPSK